MAGPTIGGFEAAMYSEFDQVFYAVREEQAKLHFSQMCNRGEVVGEVDYRRSFHAHGTFQPLTQFGGILPSSNISFYRGELRTNPFYMKYTLHEYSTPLTNGFSWGHIGGEWGLRSLDLEDMLALSAIEADVKEYTQGIIKFPMNNTILLNDRDNIAEVATEDDKKLNVYKIERALTKLTANEVPPPYVLLCTAQQARDLRLSQYMVNSLYSGAPGASRAGITLAWGQLSADPFIMPWLPNNRLATRADDFNAERAGDIWVGPNAGGGGDVAADDRCDIAYICNPYYIDLKNLAGKSWHQSVTAQGDAQESMLMTGAYGSVRTKNEAFIRIETRPQFYRDVLPVIA